MKARLDMALRLYENALDRYERIARDALDAPLNDEDDLDLDNAIRGFAASSLTMIVQVRRELEIFKGRPV